MLERIAHVQQPTPQQRVDQPNEFVLPQPGASQGVPQSGVAYRALRQLQDDLRRELQDAAERRETVAGRLKQADPAARAGWQERLKVLDDRIIQIEREISRNVALLAQAPPSALAASRGSQFIPPNIPNNIAGDMVPIVAILSVFVLGPFAIAMSRFIWRRSSPPPAPAIDQSTMQRLEQLQQSVDTIAIEVERISEGQRFVTKLLNDRSIGPGAAEPVRASAKAGIPGER